MRRTLLVCTLVGCWLLADCGHSTGTPSINEPLVVTDDYGREVAIPDHPTRIVSTSPAITEIMFELGAGTLLVGRTDFCSYPPQAANIASIGGISNLNVESIATLNPDLVISGSMVPAKVIHALEQLGIPVVCVLEKKHFDGLYENISRIGMLCGHESAADSLNRKLKEAAHRLSSDTSKKDNTPKVYYVVGFGPGGNFTSSGNTYINDIITMAGGHNIACDIKGWSYSLEALSEENPDYIIIRREDSARFCNSHPYNKLSAVRNHHVIGLESGSIDLQVPRNIEAVRQIASRMR